MNVVQAGETGPTLSDNRVPYHGSNDHASNGIEYPAVSRTASSTANDYYTFLTHSLPHSMFEKPRAKSKINPKTSECHKLNDSPHLLKSMEEYRQEYGKGMTVSHTLEDS